MSTVSLAFIDKHSCLVGEQARGFDAHCHIGNHHLYGLVLNNGLPEGLTVSRVVNGILDCPLCGTYSTCGNAGAHGVQVPHDEFEAIVFLANYVLRWHMCI